VGIFQPRRNYPSVPFCPEAFLYFSQRLLQRQRICPRLNGRSLLIRQQTPQHIPFGFRTCCRSVRERIRFFANEVLT
jgi:hypothetical protein